MRKKMGLACSIVFSVLAMGCGIDSIVYFTPVERTYFNSNLDQPSARYFEFKTSDAINDANASGYFQGFEVYYRIYDNENDCTAEIKSIENYNDKRPSNAVQYIIDSKKYLRLTIKGQGINTRPLVARATIDRTVKIRLQDYAPSSTGEKAGVYVAGSASSIGIPYRYTLDISKGDFLFANISSTDDDVQSTSPSSINERYVNAYACVYGFDDTFKLIYSALTPLGYIKITN